MKPAMPASVSVKPIVPAEEHQRAEGQQAGQDQAQEDDRAEQAVVEERVDRRPAACRCRRRADPPRAARCPASRRPSAPSPRLEGQRQRAVACSWLASSLALAAVKLAGDLRLAGQHALDLRRRDDLVVQHHRDQAALRGAGAASWARVRHGRRRRCWNASRVSAVHFSWPSPVKSSETTHWPCCWSSCGLASPMSVPTTLAMSSRNLAPLSQADRLLLRRRRSSPAAACRAARR